MPDVQTSGGYASLLRNRRVLLAVASIGLGDGGYSVFSIAVLWLSFQLSWIAIAATGPLVLPALRRLEF